MQKCINWRSCVCVYKPLVFSVWDHLQERRHVDVQLACVKFFFVWTYQPFIYTTLRLSHLLSCCLQGPWGSLWEKQKARLSLEWYTGQQELIQPPNIYKKHFFIMATLITIPIFIVDDTGNTYMSKTIWLVNSIQRCGKRDLSGWWLFHSLPTATLGGKNCCPPLHKSGNQLTQSHLDGVWKR